MGYVGAEVSLRHPPSSLVPEPGWLVTNGQTVVGPVSTQALLRGIERGVLGPGCLARQPAWAAWRSVERLREVGAYRRTGAPRFEPERWLDAASDPDELMHLALLAAVRATSAEWGVVYRREPSQLTVTIVAGQLQHSCLGCSVPLAHPAMTLAESASVFVVGDDREGAWSQFLIAGFLVTRTVRGLALMPLRGRTGVLGVVELGRSDHPFRRRDAYVLERIALGVRLRAPATDKQKRGPAASAEGGGRRGQAHKGGGGPGGGGG